MATTRPRKSAQRAKPAQSAKPTRRDASIVTTIPATVGRAVARNRNELQKAVAGVRKEVETRAARFVREAERKLLKQLHAATEGQVRRLERRVARLERLVRP